MKPSLVTISITFLNFLIILLLTTKSQANNSEDSTIYNLSNKVPKTIKYELIVKFCARSFRDPDFCTKTLTKFQGGSFTGVLTGVIGSMYTHATGTRDKITALHKAIKAGKSDQRLRYHKCIKSYDHAVEHLMEAYEQAVKGTVGHAKQLVSSAKHEVQNCSAELARNDASGILNDNRLFQDLGDIAVAFCNYDFK